MSGIVSALLTLVVVYGYPIVFVVVVAGAFGLPVPGTTILLAAGSLAIDGDLNLIALIGLVFVTATLGDSAGYWIGRKYGHTLLTKHGHKIGVTHARVGESHKFLDRWGRWGIFITRWLLTPLCVPMNLIAGISEYPFRKFVIFAGAGELLWASLYTYLGYLFGANWSSITDYVDSISTILLSLVVGVAIIWIAVRLLKTSQ